MFCLFWKSLAVLLCLFAGSAAYPKDFEISVKNSAGKVFTSYIVEKFAEEQTLFLTLPASVSHWSVVPVVEGVEVNGERMKIHTNRVIPRTTLIITAVTAEKNYTSLFDIEVTGCKYGSYTKLVSRDIAMTLSYQGEVVYQGRVKGVYVCIPHGTIHYHSNSTDSTQFAVLDESGVHFYSTVFPGYNTTIEGSFRNVLDDPIQFDFPSFVAVTPGVEKWFLLPITGPVSAIAYDPPLDSRDPYYQVNIRREAEGVTRQTITVTSNDKNTTFFLDVYAGSCPQDKTLLRLGNSQTGSFSLDDGVHLNPNQGIQPYCVDGEAVAVLTYSQTSTVLYAFYGDYLFFQQKLNASAAVQTLAVQFPRLLTYSSQLAVTTDTPSRKWAALKFNDKSWPRASEGGWGSFGAAKTAFFRGSFAVEDVYSITFFSLFLRGDGRAEVFVNGNAISDANLGDSPTVLSILSSFCQTGSNVLAVKLTQGVSSTIQFGLALQVNKGEAVPLLDGVASDVQEHTDPQNPPRDAFKLEKCEQSKWHISSFPAELVYTFNGTAQVVNSLSLLLTLRDATVEVVGVTTAQRATLTWVNATDMRRIGSGITFANTRAFHAIHLVFRSSRPTAVADVRCVRLRGEPRFACPKQHGIANAVEGSSFHTRCPLFSTGRKIVSCARDGGAPYWREERQCFATNPENGYEFVDWTFTIRGMQEDAWPSAQDKLTQLLVEKSYLRADDISYLFTDFTSDGEEVVMTGFSRCEVDTTFGGVIQRNFKKLRPRFGALVEKKLGEAFKNATIDSVVLRRYVNWPLVIILSVIVLVVVVLVLIYFIARVRKGNVRKLARRRYNEML